MLTAMPAVAEQKIYRSSGKLSRATIAVELDQDSLISARDASQLSFTVSTIDGPVTVSLQPHDVRGGKYKAQRRTKRGVEADTGADRVRMYRGTVSTDNKKDFARVTLVRGNDPSVVTITGVMRAYGKYYSLDSENISLATQSQDAEVQGDAAFSVTEMDEAMDTFGGCATEETNSTESVEEPQIMLESPAVKSDLTSVDLPPPQYVGGVGFLPKIYGKRAVLPIATEADYEYVIARGGAAAANANILSIINAADGIYQSELGLNIEVIFQNVWLIPEDPYPGTDALEALHKFASHWQTNYGNG